MKLPPIPIMNQTNSVHKSPLISLKPLVYYLHTHMYWSPKQSPTFSLSNQNPEHLLISHMHAARPISFTFLDISKLTFGY